MPILKMLFLPHAVIKVRLGMFFVIEFRGGPIVGEEANAGRKNCRNFRWIQPKRP